LLRNKPRLKYCGLTVILSNPSRFDTVNLLSASGGHLFGNFCLRPEYNVMQCDIRVTEDKTPFLPDTKCIVVMGEAAMYDWIPEARKNTLNEARGSVFSVQGIPAIPTFFPQDAADIKAYEQQLNPASKEYAPDDDGWGDDDDDAEDAKTLGRTKRSNYAFWIRADLKKCKHILSHGVPSRTEPTYKIYPSSDEVIQVLSREKGQHLYFDIETDYEEQNMQCFAFTFDGKTIYSVPILTYDYVPAYSGYVHIIRALTNAIHNNILVAHNGSCFDYFVLAYKYSIPVREVYDTMIAMQRCFPDVEKSLGHCTSYWTWERFHKDEDSKGYVTKDQMMARLRYCGKDVYTMYLVHQAIESYAKTIPGLQDSIRVANNSIVPYLTTSMQGIRYDAEILNTTRNENDRLMEQYLRIINNLIGDTALTEIRRTIKGKARAFPGSNTQCCHYFHEMLGYPVVARSKQTGKPSLGKKAMYKLALTHDNPVIRLTLMFRAVQKEYGTLRFLPWRDDNNKIIDWKEWEKKNAQQHLL